MQRCSHCEAEIPHRLEGCRSRSSSPTGLHAVVDPETHQAGPGANQHHDGRPWLRLSQAGVGPMSGPARELRVDSAGGPQILAQGDLEHWQAAVSTLESDRGHLSLKASSFVSLPHQWVTSGKRPKAVCQGQRDCDGVPRWQGPRGAETPAGPGPSHSFLAFCSILQQLKRAPASRPSQCLLSRLCVLIYTCLLADSIISLNAEPSYNKTRNHSAGAPRLAESTPSWQ
jgi:hypothetical protein